MSAVPIINFREASTQEDNLIAQHFYQLWQDNNVAPESIRSNWLDIVLEFNQQARQNLHYKAFVAEVDGKIVGSTSCQLFAGLYPRILADDHRRYGYIWGVYVDADHRGQGIAKQLTSMAIDYLKAIACTRVILHASPSGKPVYDRLGFVPSNEMRLDIID